MLTARLRYRVPSCVILGNARLPEHRLSFHKRSIDGSGKCNAFFTGVEADAALGVIFEIPRNEKRELDRAEGLGGGYHEKSVMVILPDGASIAAQTYVADTKYIDDNLRPYSWYKEFVTRGAQEHSLPREYIGLCIDSVSSRADPDRQRELLRRAEAKSI